MIRENLFLLAWWTVLGGIVLLAMYIGMSQAATLEITGAATGYGLHNLSIAGDWVNATITNSTWNIQAGGWA